ncbi:hypothetical protein [Pseudomonas violetae]|uniref:TIR domain-containing protein n=1 Tax=Pseudomonas violetae TaxID=2915813 RepID=A0ABT0F8H5_9PSED|nr:hypothetical protein [Pseudomonas violetae]MCK1794316.1 hypothetical protein [Pseudomonas violetae]
MPTRINDFTTLFNALWYRDFPVVLGHIEVAKRADWTTHIASTVRQVSSLMGLFSCFESGGRTDAEIKFANKNVWAKLEWEWDEPKEQRVEELVKLARASSGADVSVFIGYSQVGSHQTNLEQIRSAWAYVDKPLVVLLITFECEGEWRFFDKLQTYSCTRDVLTLIREQPALPWSVANSRWAACISANGVPV